MPAPTCEVCCLLYWFTVYSRFGASESHLLQTAQELHEGCHSYEREGVIIKAKTYVFKWKWICIRNQSGLNEIRMIQGSKSARFKWVSYAVNNM